MWYIVDPKGKRYYLSPFKPTRFGRKVGDILLENDPSISRLHACMSLISDTEHENAMCVVEDLNSKYGTWIESGYTRRRVKSVAYHLKDQDKVQFGVLKQIFKVVFVPLVVAASTLDPTEVLELSCMVDNVDGSFSKVWTYACTHLTVARAALTEKVACAMASAVPIVPVSYWKSVQDAIEKGDPLPDPKEFTPLIDERLLGKRKDPLVPNVKRKTLFSNKVFVHFRLEQYEMYGIIIELAGGDSILYKSSRTTVVDLCAPNVIVLQHSDPTMSQSTMPITDDYDVICELLEKNKLRMIPETEIALAIWNCSIEKYCNPRFSFATFLKREKSSLPTAPVLVLDTQDETSNKRSFPRILSDVPVASNISLNHATTGHPIIPETCDEFSTQRISTTDCVNDFVPAAKMNEPQIIKETADTFADTSFTQKTKQISEVSSTRENVYIPETNDSSFSNEIDKYAVDFEQNIENSPKQVYEMQVSTKDQEMVKIKVKQELNASITENLNVNDDSEVEVINWDSDAEEKYNKLRCTTLNKEGTNSPVKLNTKIVKECKENCSPVPRETQESHKRTMKTARSASENDTDEECIPFAKKDVSLENSGISVGGHETTDSSEPDTFLRVNSKAKKFRKVHKNIPNTRVALNDMYVWDVCYHTE